MFKLTLLAASATAALSLNAPLVSRVAQRSAPPTMQINKKVVSFDQDGVFEGRETSVQKPPVRLLERLEELRLLSSISKAGLLSGAEEAGIFSKLESAGAYSKLEKLLPLADDLKVLSTLEGLLNVEAGYLFSFGALLLLGEAGLIFAVPDDTPALIALQAGTGVLAGAGAVTLWALSFLFSVLQGEN